MPKDKTELKRIKQEIAESQEIVDTAKDVKEAICDILAVLNRWIKAHERKITAKEKGIRK